MLWLTLTIISYLLLAIVNIGDKFVVDKVLKNGKVYAFVVGVMSAVVFIIAPWFLKWPGPSLFLLNILAGAFFILALWTMYESLKRGEASQVVVVIGSIIPVFTIIFSILFFKESFKIQQWIGMFFLVLGMILISFIFSKKKKTVTYLRKLKSVFRGTYKKKWVFLAILSAFLYAVFFISTKYAYEEQEFLSAFIWTRGGGLLVVLLFLLDKDSRQDILNNFKTDKKKKTKAVRLIKKKETPRVGKFFILVNQALGSISFLLQNYAIYLGPVAIINALQGVQYALLLLLGIFFSLFFPKIMKEDISPSVLKRKVLAIVLVGVGLYFISI